MTDERQVASMLEIKIAAVSWADRGMPVVYEAQNFFFSYPGTRQEVIEALHQVGFKEGLDPAMAKAMHVR